MAEPTSIARSHLSRIYRAAIRAVEPTELVRRHLCRDGPSSRIEAAGLEWKGPATVVGAGKAAARMAAGCEDALGGEMVHGIVIVPEGTQHSLRSIRAIEASHPLPDDRSAQATEQICRLLESGCAKPILCLISGGASSLLVRPRPPVSVADKQETTRLLLASGADIHQANTVRKHLSEVKGGGLLRFAGGRRLVSLILSDVVGDDLSAIGSGPTVSDPSTFADALSVLRQVDLERRVPAGVRLLLERGLRGEVEETVKPGHAVLRQTSNLLVGSNRTALKGAAEEARRLGYSTVILDDALSGDTSQSARHWAREVDSQLTLRAGRPCCVLAGGETTVVVRGSGQGGRNQEFALAAAEGLAGLKVSALSAGTDGIDGPTTAAGAFVDGQTLHRARSLGLDVHQVLLENDSHWFFSELSDLFDPGPTGTNVMDIKIAVSVGSGDGTPVLHD